MRGRSRKKLPRFMVPRHVACCPKRVGRRDDPMACVCGGCDCSCDRRHHRLSSVSWPLRVCGRQSAPPVWQCLKGGSDMKWITRERVKVDRVACPWLIKKFIDPEAEFLFVPPDEVMAAAKRENAIPYDVKDVELGHHGKQCSFDAIVKKYNLDRDPAMALLAKIVNGADTDNSLWNQPEAAGLNAIAEGFRHVGFKDDHEINAAQWIVYDALYAYCQEMIRRGKPDGSFR